MGLRRRTRRLRRPEPTARPRPHPRAVTHAPAPATGRRRRWGLPRRGLRRGGQWLQGHRAGGQWLQEPEAPRRAPLVAPRPGHLQRLRARAGGLGGAAVDGGGRRGGRGRAVGGLGWVYGSIVLLTFAQEGRRRPCQMSCARVEERAGSEPRRACSRFSRASLSPRPARPSARGGCGAAGGARRGAHRSSALSRLDMAGSDARRATAAGTAAASGSAVSRPGGPSKPSSTFCAGPHDARGPGARQSGVAGPWGGGEGRGRRAARRVARRETCRGARDLWRRPLGRRGRDVVAVLRGRARCAHPRLTRLVRRRPAAFDGAGAGAGRGGKARPRRTLCARGGVVASVVRHARRPPQGARSAALRPETTTSEKFLGRGFTILNRADTAPPDSRIGASSFRPADMCASPARGWARCGYGRTFQSFGRPRGAAFMFKNSHLRRMARLLDHRAAVLVAGAAGVLVT